MPSLRTKVDHKVSRFDHIQIVLDDHDGMPMVNQPIEAHEQPIDVGEVQTGRWLIENVEIVFTAFELRQLASKFDALSFTAGEDRGRMADRDVSQPKVIQDRNLAGDRWLIPEELDAFFNRQIQDLGNASSLGI